MISSKQRSNLNLFITMIFTSTLMPPSSGGTIIKLKLPKKMSGSMGGGGGVMQMLAAGIVVKLLQGGKLPDLSNLLNFKGRGDSTTMVTPILVPMGSMMSSGMAGWPLMNSGGIMMGMDSGWSTAMMNTGWNSGGMMNTGWNNGGMMSSGWNSGGDGKMMNQGWNNGRGAPMMGNMGD